MAILNDALKISTAQKFNSLSSEAGNIINRLKDIKNEIIGIKNNMETDTINYTAGDVSEANAKIVALATSIGEILS